MSKILERAGTSLLVSALSQFFAFFLDWTKFFFDFSYFFEPLREILEIESSFLLQSRKSDGIAFKQDFCLVIAAEEDFRNKSVFESP